jgi:hypothetical protein
MFLVFDPKTNNLVEPPVYRASVKLAEEIERFGMWHTSGGFLQTFEPAPRRVGKNHQLVKAIKLATTLNVLHRWSNILDLYVNIVRFLDGHPYVEPNLFSQYVDDESQILAAEVRVTSEEVESILGISKSKK